MHIDEAIRIVPEVMNNPIVTIGTNKMYIVKLNRNLWLAPWSGDPGRTTVEGNATEFKTKSAAKRALTAARKYK